MRSVLQLLVVAVALGLGACGNSIGDGCGSSSDCSQQGDRICDQSSPGGYCTVIGCDVGTCPDEAVCVSFFPVTQLTEVCTPATVETDCASDEVCSAGKCAHRTTEQRYCMKKCGDAPDCRDDYECRAPDRVASHGGEPVPDPDDGLVASQPYCAPARPCGETTDCLEGDVCDLGARRCIQAGSR